VKIKKFTVVEIFSQTDDVLDSKASLELDVKSSSYIKEIMKKIFFFGQEYFNEG